MSNCSEENIGLAALFHPHSLKDFFRHAWPGHPLCVHDLKATVEPLTALPFLASLETLLNSWPGSVQVHLPDLADESSSISATPADAKKLFSNGMALLFNEVQKQSPLLQQWLFAIQNELGLPAMTHSRCMVYATPAGIGTAAHFDQNINFILQLTGTKKWWLAPNTHVEHPSQRHTIGTAIDPELASYLEQGFPRKMPESCKEVILKPGSCLFVPQGYWHSTEAEGEALSLNFTFSQPSYLDLLMAALRSRLLQSPEWRALADGVSGQDEARKQMAVVKFDALLLELTGDLPDWNATDILGATEK